MFSFPYLRKRIDEGIIADPRIDLVVETPRGQTVVTFLLDSGADVTTLPLKRFGPILNYHPNPQERIKIGGVTGTGVSAYPFTLKVSLGGTSFKLRCYLINSPIDPLLGRLDFWNLFSVTFDNQNQKTIISPLTAIN